jgi:hypothetical protein
MTRRGRVIKEDFNRLDLYKFYNDTRKEDVNITQRTFTKIISAFNREVIKLILYKNYSFRLPFGLGYISVIKKKQKDIEYDESGKQIKQKLLVDYHKTKQLWERDEEAKQKKKLVLHLNEHTDGYIYRYNWDKGGCAVTNLFSYKFKPSRENSRWLASVIKDKSLNVDYFLK